MQCVRNAKLVLQRGAGRSHRPVWAHGPTGSPAYRRGLILPALGMDHVRASERHGNGNGMAAVAGGDAQVSTDQSDDDAWQGRWPAPLVPVSGSPHVRVNIN